MSFYDVYIGDLTDPEFRWEGGDNSGNIPRRIGPLFPGSTLGSGAFHEVIQRIESGMLDGKKVDWAGWVAKATKDQIEVFLTEVYGEAVPGDLKACVQELDPQGSYALVAAESD